MEGVGEKLWGLATSRSEPLYVRNGDTVPIPDMNAVSSGLGASRAREIFPVHCYLNAQISPRRMSRGFSKCLQDRTPHPEVLPLVCAVQWKDLGLDLNIATRALECSIPSTHFLPMPLPKIANCQPGGTPCNGVGK